MVCSCANVIRREFNEDLKTLTEYVALIWGSTFLHKRGPVTEKAA